MKICCAPSGRFFNQVEKPRAFPGLICDGAFSAELIPASLKLTTPEADRLYRGYYAV